MTAIESKKEDSEGLASASLNLAIVYEKSKKYDKAEKYFLQAQKIYSDIKNRSVGIKN